MSKEENEPDVGEVEINEEAEGPPSVESLKKETESTASAEQVEKLKNDLLYLKAEFDNFRKNSIKERSELIKYGPERLIRQLLDVIDNFDRALEADINPENIQSFKEGFEMTSKELKDVLSQFGLSSHNPKGEAFDPQVHEALSSEETDEVEPGHIHQVFKKAYKLHDKVIRPAQVVVAKEKTTEE